MLPAEAVQVICVHAGGLLQFTLLRHTQGAAARQADGLGPIWLAVFPLLQNSGLQYIHSTSINSIICCTHNADFSDVRHPWLQVHPGLHVWRELPYQGRFHAQRGSAAEALQVSLQLMLLCLLRLSRKQGQDAALLNVRGSVPGTGNLVPVSQACAWLCLS